MNKYVFLDFEQSEEPIDPTMMFIVIIIFPETNFRVGAVNSFFIKKIHSGWYC